MVYAVEFKCCVYKIRHARVFCSSMKPHFSSCLIMCFQLQDVQKLRLTTILQGESNEFGCATWVQPTLVTSDPTHVTEEDEGWWTHSDVLGRHKFMQMCQSDA